jgi:hypothetical protein
MTAKLPKALQREADLDLLTALGIEVSRLSDVEIREGGEAARRVSACDRIPGAGKRRPAAIIAWAAFRANHGGQQ